MARVLYLYRDPPFARFIRDDLAIIRTRHDVDDVHLEGSARCFARLLSAAARADLVYFWWGDITGLLGASLARLFGVPSLMVTGGYDVADVPTIRYGLRYHPWRRYLPPLVLRLATRIVANAQVARDGVMQDFGVPGARIACVPHGLDPQSIPFSAAARERSVLTCSLLSKSYIPYKGLDTFVEVARRFPDVPFLHAGPHRDPEAVQALQASAPPNVRFLGFLSDAELLAAMGRASVYAQLSAHEGFGIALAEAMLSGATPVVTRAGAIPEVVGNVGEYCEYGDVESTAGAIERALARPRPEQARARIATHFTIERRRDEILAILDGLLGVPQPARAATSG